MADAYFDGDVVVVTGAGRGLGRAHALALGRAGASVVVNDLDGDVAREVVAEIEAAGGKAAAAVASVSTGEGARAIVEAAVAAFGTVDAVVNNAGYMRNALFEDISERMLDEMLEVHIRGAFLVTQAAYPIMREQGYGRVVLTSSSGGLFASAGRINYSAAKAGLYGMCKGLAYEAKGHGILVNALLPFANTTITAANPVPGHSEGFPPGLREALEPLRLPEAVAPLVAYLCSRACTVTGEAFSAGMGHFARVFVGAARGWAAPDPAAITIADVDEHFDQIRDLDDATVPMWIYDELEAIAQAIGVVYEDS
jgi:NAD(P)-dependent dehydrogenase (short-subunit alcohol dehydrogenase family)